MSLNRRGRFAGGITEDDVGMQMGFILPHESNPGADVLEGTGLEKISSILSESSVMGFELQEGLVKVFGCDTIFSGDA